MLILRPTKGQPLTGGRQMPKVSKTLHMTKHTKDTNTRPLFDRHCHPTAFPSLEVSSRPGAQGGISLDACLSVQIEPKEPKKGHLALQSNIFESSQRTKPNQAKPNQTKPSQAKPNQTKPSELCAQQLCTGDGSQRGTGHDRRAQHLSGGKSVGAKGQHGKKRGSVDSLGRGDHKREDVSFLALTRWWTGPAPQQRTGDREDEEHSWQ